MDDAIAIGATVLAVVLALAAFALVWMERPVAAGTCFLFTAFAIYVRETRG